MSEKKDKTPVDEAPKKNLEKEVKKVDVDAFIQRKLKDINELGKPAKAKALASRVIRNRKEN